MRSISKELLLREWTKERVRDFYEENERVMNYVLSSPEYFQIVTEWETLHWCAGNLLTEAPAAAPAPCNPDEVCSILQGLDSKLTDSESKLAKVIEALVELAQEFVPESVQQAAEDAKAELGSKIDSATGVSKNTGDDKRSDEEKKSGAGVDDISGIIEFFKELFELFKAVISGWKESGAEAGTDGGLKKKISLFVTKHSESVKELGSKLMEFKDLYKENKTFKAVVNAMGQKVAVMVAKLITDLIALIPGMDAIKQAAKMLIGAARIGGKIFKLFKAAKAAKASPEEKLAAIVKQTARAKDQKLGAMSKVLQLDDELQSILDDKLEGAFIEWYTKYLRSIPGNTKISSIDVNKKLEEFIKTEYGKSRVNVGVESR